MTNWKGYFYIFILVFDLLQLSFPWIAFKLGFFVRFFKTQGEALKKLKAILAQKLKVPELFPLVSTQNSTYWSYLADFSLKLNQSELFIGIDPLSHIPKKLLNLFFAA